VVKTFDRELKNLLRAAGCWFERQAKGSHEIWWSPITNRHITVPNGCVIRHTANAVLKDAGLPKAF
jgi:predicted RNA binding protein YcfA (HicA-like mRNA interferase family)